MDSAAFERLVVELQDPKYAGIDASQIVAALTEKTETEVNSRLVNERTLYDEMDPQVAETILQKLDAASAQNPIVKRAYGWFSPDQAGIDPSRPSVIDMIDQLTASNVLTSEESAALKGLGQKMISRADELNLGEVYEGHIQMARIRNNG